MSAASTPPHRAAPRRPALSRDLLILAVPVALVALIYAIYALRAADFQSDEEQYLAIARIVAGHFPSALWQTGLFTRGTQRLDPIILALPFALMRGPGAYQLAHIIQCALFASTAIPCFLLARRAGLPRAACMFAALLCLVVPWAVVTTSYLAECVAYPAYAWVIYATWNTTVRPSVRNDVLALLALVVAALSRTAMLALTPILPLAILWQEWAWGLRGRPLRQRPRALAARVWAAHPLLSVVIALGLLALLLGGLGLLPGRGLAALAGDYALPQLEPVFTVLDRYREYLSRMTVGTGVIALALAVPWAAYTLARARDGAQHALAVVCTLGLAAILLSLLHAPGDERYVLYCAVPISLACAAALSELASVPRIGKRAALGVLAGTAAVIALLAAASWPPLASPYDYFTYPAAIFYQRVLLEHARLASAPLGHLSANTLIVVGLALMMMVWVLVAGRVRGAARPAAVVLGVGMIAMCAIQDGYTLRKFTTGADGGPSASARSWVDEHVAPSVRVGALAVGLGEAADYVPIWLDTEFWNTSVKLDVFFATSGTLPFPPYSEAVQLKIQPGSGLLSALAGPHTATPVEPPEWLLIPAQGTNPIVLAGKPVARSSYVPLALVHLSRPARALWEISSTSAEGFLTSGQTASATVFSGALAGLRPPCASFSLIAPGGLAGSWPYVVDSGPRTLRGHLRAAQAAAVNIPLFPTPTPHGPSATLTAKVSGQTTLFGGVVASAKLAFFNVGQCPRSSAPR